MLGSSTDVLQSKLISCRTRSSPKQVLIYWRTHSAGLQLLKHTFRDAPIGRTARRALMTSQERKACSPCSSSSASAPRMQHAGGTSHTRAQKSPWLHTVPHCLKIPGREGTTIFLHPLRTFTVHFKLGYGSVMTSAASAVRKGCFTSVCDAFSLSVFSLALQRRTGRGLPARLSPLRLTPWSTLTT